MMDLWMDLAGGVPSPFQLPSNTPIRRSCCGCFPAYQGTRDFADLSISDSSRACSRDQIRAASIRFSMVALNDPGGNFHEVKDKEIPERGPANGHHALSAGSRREHRLRAACHALRSQAQDMGNECSTEC